VTSAATYEAWARTFHGSAFSRRTAASHAAFLLPSLAPGQRVLDLGCGPGGITRGLADAVSPSGEVVGVDADEVYLELARAAVPAARFERADAADLPFDDDSFDVAFLSAVLQHVASPEAVLAEVRRVVRPGGVVGVSDADLDGFLLHPMSDGLRAAVALDRRTRRNPDVGRRLPELLHGAGFEDIEFTAVASVVRGDAGGAVRRLEAEPFVAHAVAQGWVADAGELAAMAAAWRAWASSPGSVFVTLWCQALAR
jgi:SAM-dependent methyltransferase